MPHRGGKEIMKWIELTDEQMKQIPEEHFDLLTVYRPGWMSENRPDLLAAHRPVWMAAQPDVPEDIVAKLTSPTGAERK